MMVFHRLGSDLEIGNYQITKELFTKLKYIVLTVDEKMHGSQ